MTKKERIAMMLAHAKATAAIYRALADHLVSCAQCLEDDRNTEWSGMPTATEDLSKALGAGFILDHIVKELRK